MNEPALPYHGTEGFVDNEASRERAVREAQSGEASKRQQAVLSYLLSAGLDGRTWREVASHLDLHHGQASGSLSVLHKTGLIFQLRKKRGKSHPYVHDSFRGWWEESDRIDDPAMVRSNKRVAELQEQLEAWRNTAGIMYEAVTEGDCLTAIQAYLEVAKEHE